MRIYIHSVYDTAYKYKDILAKYNYEHIRVVNEKELKYCEEDTEYVNLNNFIYHDYITINSLEDLENLIRDLEIEVIISRSNDFLEIEIYDDYRE